MKDKKVFRYEFVVDGLDREQADWLMDIITRCVEFERGHVYGGFVKSKEAEEGEHEPEQ